MAYVLLAFLALIALGLWIAGRPYVAAWWFRTFRDPEVYPPEAAEAPEHERIDTPTDDIDWHRYEYELKRKQT